MNRKTMPSTSIRLPMSLIERLDSRAREVNRSTGVPTRRSDLIRALLESALDLGLPRSTIRAKGAR